MVMQALLIYKEMLTPEVDRQEFPVETLTPEVDRQKTTMFFCTREEKARQ